MIDTIPQAFTAALAAPPPQGDAFTVAELAIQAGLPPTNHARQRLREWLAGEVAAGRVTMRRVPRRCLDGTVRHLPGYAPV